MFLMSEVPLLGMLVAMLVSIVGTNIATTIRNASPWHPTEGLCLARVLRGF